MARQSIKKYIPNDIDFNAMRYCFSINIVFYIEQVKNMIGYFWIVKYKPTEYKSVSYMRIDLEKSDTPKNRVVLNEYDAMKKCFDYYKMVYNKK